MVRQRTANPLSPVRIWVPPPVDNPERSVVLQNPAQKRGFYILTVRYYRVNTICIPVPISILLFLRVQLWPTSWKSTSGCATTRRGWPFFTGSSRTRPTSRERRVSDWLADRGPLEILAILTCVLGWDILPKFLKAGIATLM